MSVQVRRKVTRSIYGLTINNAGPDDLCILCLREADIEYEGFFYCWQDGGEKFADDMFHAKLYARSIGAHS